MTIAPIASILANMAYRLLRIGYIFEVDLLGTDMDVKVS
jgi:hypothetical protein